MIRELIIILGITYLGNFLSPFFPFPMPGPVIGLVLLFILLLRKIIKIEDIKMVSGVMLGNLAFLFLPPGVGLLNSMPLLRENGVKLLVLVLSTTVITMVATGFIVQFLIKRQMKKRGE